MDIVSPRSSFRSIFRRFGQDQRRYLQLGAAHVLLAHGQEAFHRLDLRLYSEIRAGLAQNDCHAAAAAGRELRIASRVLGTGKDPTEMWPKGA